MLDIRSDVELTSINGREFRFAVERYDEVVNDIQPLLPEHWAELAVHKDIPLEPEFHFYSAMDEAGALKIFTVRYEGALVGYSIFVVRPRHAHYAIAWAMNDIVWLRPDRRNEGVGTAFVQFWDRHLFDFGVTIVHVNVKVAHPVLMYLLKSRGYATIECGMEKRLR